MSLVSRYRLALLMGILHIVFSRTSALSQYSNSASSKPIIRVKVEAPPYSTGREAMTESFLADQLLTRTIFVEPHSSRVQLVEEGDLEASVEDTNADRPRRMELVASAKDVTTAVSTERKTDRPRVISVALNDYMPTSDELNLSFLKLFDELWRIKSSSIQALVTLEYFTTSLNESLAVEEQPIKQSTSSTKSPQVELPTTSAPPELVVEEKPTKRPPSKATSKPSISVNGQLVPANTVVGKMKNPMDFMQSIKVQTSEMLQNLRHRLDRVFTRLKWPLSRQIQGRLAGAKLNRSGEIESNLGETVDRLLGLPSDAGSTSSLTARTKRQIGQNDNCVRLSPSQVQTCTSYESLVGASLSSSFPGTLTAIEESCNNISYLIGVCWPNQLELLKSMLVSRNETLVNATDFPLPGSGRVDSKFVPRSCGLESLLDRIVLERINWMWLNLCMDKRFRSDYASNLKCLSLWSQERARLVCNSEYKRMQANMAAKDLLEPASSSRDNELESKTICCAFDLFLRCVYRQAVRDCGRAGGQFVVNFMSRVGSEDMKYLCNSEPKQMVRTLAKQAHQSPQGQLQDSGGGGGGSSQRIRLKAASAGGSLNQKLDRGPFIESGYCSESKVSVALHEGLSSALSRLTAVAPSSSGARSSPGNNGVHDDPRKNVNSSKQVLDDPNQYSASSNSCGRLMEIYTERAIALALCTAAGLLRAWIV